MQNTNQITQKPPVPKFDLSNTLSCHPIDEDNKDRIAFQNYKKRQRNIVTMINSLIAELPESLQNIDVEKKAIQFLTQDVLLNLKSKKYMLIAQAAVIHSIALLYEGNVIRRVLKEYQNQDIIIKMLFKLQQEQIISSGNLIQYVVETLNQQLGLNEKFNEVCQLVIQILIDLGFYMPRESLRLTAAAIVKITGDVVFLSRGGIESHVIAQISNCSLFELTSKLEKIRPYGHLIIQRIIKKYEKSHCL